MGLCLLRKCPELVTPRDAPRRHHDERDLPVSNAPLNGSTALIEAPRRKRWPWLLGALVALALIVGGVVLLTGEDDSTAGAKTVRIGVVGASDPYWATYKDAAADEGIDV